MKFLRKIFFPIIVSFIIVSALYQHYNQISPFRLAALRLGLNSPQQEALLRIFHMAGYLDPDHLWYDMNKMGGVKNVKEAFKPTYDAIIKSGADKKSPASFDPKIMADGMCVRMQEQDCMDLILYVAQNAFNRELGVERNELTSKEWMKQYQSEFLASASVLGLINRINPLGKEYDAALIAGASRIGILARLVDYNFYLKNGIKITGDTFILAGNRELWAEIDGIAPNILEMLEDATKHKVDLDKINATLSVNANSDLRSKINEGKLYITSLAERNGIKLDEQNPFIIYKTKEDCPKGRFPNRTYPNYANGETKVITESMMSIDMFQKYIAHYDMEILDPQNANNTDKIAQNMNKGSQIVNNSRSDTVTTAMDAAEIFMKNALQGKYGNKTQFKLLLFSNQPYVVRQGLSTVRNLKEIMRKSPDFQHYKIDVEYVGFGNKQDVPTIDSELSALIAELYINAMIGQTPVRNLETLIFQTRDKTIDNSTQHY